MGHADGHRSLLLVSSSEKLNSRLLPMLPPEVYECTDTVSDAAAARQRLREREYGVVLINSPLPGGGSGRLAEEICAGSAGVVLLVREDEYAGTAEHLTQCGAFVLAKPTQPRVLLQVLGAAAATNVRLTKIERRAEEKETSAEAKIAEMRIIDRAKWLLIDQLKMTEKQAHRYIEKQAMDRCVTRRAIAENIMTLYNDGGIEP